MFTLAVAVSTANAAFQGFNYGATFSNGAVKAEDDFEAEFKTMQGLEGTNGAFNSARLYTMIQGGTPNDPISAIPAAIKTKTSMLFGLWASAGEAAFNGEIEALQKTIDQYCDQLDGLVAGISVGSEDLYRISPIGIGNNENPGASPDTLVGYIDQVRKTIAGTCLSNAPIGHVDTWTAYDNSSNSALIEALDWVGMDAYAYFENTKPNAIENGANLFQEALGKVRAAAGGRDIWITETGWPVSGKTVGEGVASPENARTFWEEVGCPMFGVTNVWWYTFQDSVPNTPNPSFGIIGSELTTKPLYDLSCDGSTPRPSASSSSASSSASETSSAAASSSAAEFSSSASTDNDEASTSTSDKLKSESTSVSTGDSSSETSVVSNTGSGSQPTTVVVSGPSTKVLVTSYAPAPTDDAGANPSGTDSSGSTPSEVPQAGSTQLNSLGAAAFALIMAVGLL